MANRKVFSTLTRTSRKPVVLPTNTINPAGGVAYSLGDEASLAQYTVTSCFGRTFYASEKEQVDKVLQLARACTPEFVAKAAVYGHQVAGMKDAPAMLCAVLATRGLEGQVLLEYVFPKVITRVKMLMNFVQIIRSGVVGRRSFGTAIKKLVNDWLNNHSGDQLFTGGIGAQPSLADIIKMTHPSPIDAEHNAFYAYSIGKPYEFESLPPKVRTYEQFKKVLAGQGASEWPSFFDQVPDVPFQMLASLPNIKPDHWKSIARNMPWNALRMNLNTLARHGVFNDNELTGLLAAKLGNAEEVRRNNVFPYQLLTTFQNTTDVPLVIRNALQDAMEVATQNLPDFGCPLAICIDVSGSMSSPATGHRTGATTKTRYVDIAALVGAGLARKNKDHIVLPYDTQVHTIQAKGLNARDTVMTNASKLAGFGGGGTDSSLPLRVLNGLVGGRPELIIYVSDNMSWFNSRNYGWGTVMANEWSQYKAKTPKAKLVCIDIDANESTQVQESPDVLNIGGFSDRIWPVIENFYRKGDVNFVDTIKAVDLNA